MTNEQRPLVAVSACLLGQHTRYDGGHNHVPLLIRALQDHCRLRAICPEAGCGLPTPREPMELFGSALWVRVCGVFSGTDYSSRLLPYCQTLADTLKADGACGFLLKSNSPSCACMVEKNVHAAPGDNTPTGCSLGVFARTVRGLMPYAPMVDEHHLVDSVSRETFLRQIRRVSSALRAPGREDSCS